MIAIMTVRTATRFMLWMRTALLFIITFIVMVLLLLLMKYPPVPFIMEQELIIHYGNYCHRFYNGGVNH